MVAAIAGGFTAFVFSCTTDAVSVDACRRIEDTRCDRAVECGIQLSTAVAKDVESCKRFYREQCLHGLVSKVSISGPPLEDCLGAIRGGTCPVVLNPETEPACWFLKEDAGSDAEAGPPAEVPVPPDAAADPDAAPKSPFESGPLL